MSTELQQQISRIRESQILSAPVHAGVPSLFLDAKEAARLDISVVHEAALTALVEIEQYDDRISRFRGNLLHESSRKLQRELKTKEVLTLLII